MNKLVELITKKINNNHGISLPIIIAVFAVLSILFTSSIMVMQNNIKQIDFQEDNIRAYYVARSGIDIAYAALMMDNKENFNRIINDEDLISSLKPTLGSEDEVGSKIPIRIENEDLSITDMPVPGNGPDGLTVYEDTIGTVSVEIYLVYLVVEIDTNKSTEFEEVRIHGTSQMIDDNESYSLSLFLNKDNVEKRRWER